jgi:hypothetical protein
VASRDVRGGENWPEVDRKEDSQEPNGDGLTGTFAVAGCGACHFIRLVNTGRNHFGNDFLSICVWEIFGSILK